MATNLPEPFRPQPFPLPPIPLQPSPVPAEVTRVDGCSCGGLTMHEERCTIFSLPYADGLAAIDAAQARLREYTASLNASLDASLSGGVRVALHTGTAAPVVVALGGGRGYEDGEMAAIIRECCQRFRPDLVGPQDGATFAVMSGMTGRRFRVTVTEEPA